MSFRSILLILLSLTVTNSAAGQSIIYNKLAGVKGLDSALLQISLGNLPVGKTGAQKAACKARGCLDTRVSVFRRPFESP